jgi:GNAT superfamily N-acetyltransferase
MTESTIGETMTEAAAGEPAVTVTDAVDEHARAVIADGLSAYNHEKVGYRDFRPLDVIVSDPESGEVIGGLFGRTSLGLLFIERVFLPARLRGQRLGSRLIALAEEEAKRRGCSRAALFTLTFQAPGFYRKLGYEAAARLECDPPGATRMLMTKRLS